MIGAKAGSVAACSSPRYLVQAKFVSKTHDDTRRGEGHLPLRRPLPLPALDRLRSLTKAQARICHARLP